ncbi:MULTISPECIES: helix-turn-helix domain-containing protein [unclassified Pseudonocardia]|uniref:helix-turn-helix domain-containing protein n=1 Tax=unclassified Pseudonocardia TaxID=2619320 RepID=UPI001BDD5DEC
MSSNWREVRAKRPPREDRVALHRAHLDEVVRAHQLREIRAEQGVTQRELAQRMHVSQPSVSAIERGELTKAGLGTIRAYVEALGGTVDVVANFGDQRVVLG